MTDYDSDTSDTERRSECDSCGQSLVSFSDERLDDGCCPYCLGPITVTDSTAIEQYCPDCGIIIGDVEYRDEDGEYTLVPSYCPRCSTPLKPDGDSDD